MRMKKKIFSGILILILMVLLSHCNKDNSPNFPVDLLKETDITSGVEFVKGKSVLLPDTFYPFIFYNNGYVFVNDYGTDGTDPKQKNVLSKYNKELEFIEKKYIPMGMGPGDLGNGAIFSGRGDKVFVSDNTQRRISVFNKDFEYLYMKKQKNPLYAADFFGDGEGFLGLIHSGDYSKLERKWDFCKFTFPGLKKKVLHVHGPYTSVDFERKKGIIGRTACFHFFHNKYGIYFLDMATYELSKYSIDGKILKRVKVEVPEIRVPASKKAVWLKDQVGRFQELRKFDLADTVQPASWMVPLEKGFVVVRRNRYSIECTGTVEGDYFNYDLALKGKVKIPCFFLIFKLRRAFFANTIFFRNNYLYLVKESGDEFMLEKWLVKE
jgi:hypothetical protein